MATDDFIAVSDDQFLLSFESQVALTQLDLEGVSVNRFKKSWSKSSVNLNDTFDYCPA